MNAPHGKYSYPPYYKLRTRKQRIRRHRLAVRAGVNPEEDKAQFGMFIVYTEIAQIQQDLSRFALPIIHKREIITATND